MPEVFAAVRTARIIHAMFLACIFLYAMAGEATGPAQPRDISLFRIVFGAVGASTLGGAIVLRQLLLGKALLALRERPGDGAEQISWLGVHLLGFVLMETLGLFGLALRFLGGTLYDAAPFYVAAVAGLLVFTPRIPEESA